MSLVSVVDNSDWLQAGQPRDRSSIPGREEFSPRRPDRLTGPPNLLSNGYRSPFPGGKTARA
jgi:hypothetical protein